MLIMNHEIALYWKTHIGNVRPYAHFDEFFLSLGHEHDYYNHIHLITNANQNIYAFKVNGQHPKKGTIPNDKKHAIRWVTFLKKQLHTYIRREYKNQATTKCKTRRKRTPYNKTRQKRLAHNKKRNF
jgi:hypothetical protein